MDAVKKNREALQFASEDLCRDREILMAALKLYGEALKFKSDYLEKKGFCDDCSEEAWVGTLSCLQRFTRRQRHFP